MRGVRKTAINAVSIFMGKKNAALTLYLLQLNVAKNNCQTFKVDRERDRASRHRAVGFEPVMVAFESERF